MFKWSQYENFIPQIFRHGQRNIMKSYPKDPYKDEVHWPGGFGQLTNVKLLIDKLISVALIISKIYFRKVNGNYFDWDNIYEDVMINC